MLRPLLIPCIVALCLVTHGNLSYGQTHSIGPYFGGSGSIAGGGGPGWGVEAGMHFPPFFYSGIEYGVLYPFPTVLTYDAPIGSTPSPGPSGADEQFLGIHVGFVLHDPIKHSSLWVGVVVLKSYQPWESWDSVSTGWVPFTKTYLNIGPDFRISSIDDGHFYLALAYTIRRGFKLGIGYTL